MHPFFSVTLYTGQQLVLEGLQRWVTRPCKELENRRQRASLRALAMLLVKTTATGMLAAVLDAAIEYRSRQLLAAAEEGEREAPAPSRLASIGLISRPGVAAWKARLLQAIDEMERRAERYGLGPSSRLAAEAQTAAAPKDKGLAHGPHGCGSLADFEADAETEAILSQTVQQLQELMRQSGRAESSEPACERQVDTLLDSLLGAGLGERGADFCLDGGVLADPGVCAAAARRPRRVRVAPDGAVEGCQICMDAGVSVAVAGCGHELCFGCARQLCSAREHLVPACPFCRQPIEGFEVVAAEDERLAASD
ncbi:hypothetical protein F751_0486 [Auxenochlorella protothecoides]|uniref:RING-type domain-containing protein n=1 Tax=Auxenochlorella protothecoides TaxID=3075 RepID=A0A087SIA5_AUXPR|nr:hypothetical protein F751_0486 [Auxenochlorella protothecoides]KFM25459.1 hypothetical protein F751_0486 [Auxenochlorella protothecoides]RMZ54626.1 hypothetical protein APUTEX25_003004 [Auxenochlorella protothecoides]|eukprot:RMZ54626.1 hypothetical protein APUTEX25_003004 [Auxenochlorella protothecoides]